MRRASSPLKTGGPPSPSSAARRSATRPTSPKGSPRKKARSPSRRASARAHPIYRMRYKGVPFYYIRAHGRTPNKDSKIIAPSGDEYVKTWVALYDLGVQYVARRRHRGRHQRRLRLRRLRDRRRLHLDGKPEAAERSRRSGDRPRQLVRELCGAVLPRLAPHAHRRVQEERTKDASTRPASSSRTIRCASRRPAEIRMMRGMGADMVSHNVVTEAIYARQLGMHFAVLNSVSNPATGVKPYTYEDMQDSVARIAAGRGTGRARGHRQDPRRSSTRAGSGASASRTRARTRARPKSCHAARRIL